MVDKCLFPSLFLLFCLIIHYYLLSFTIQSFSLFSKACKVTILHILACCHAPAQCGNLFTLSYLKVSQAGTEYTTFSVVLCYVSFSFAFHISKVFHTHFNYLSYIFIPPKPSKNKKYILCRNASSHFCEVVIFVVVVHITCMKYEFLISHIIATISFWG